MKISAVIISLNEAARIASCIASVQDIVDEVLLVDSNSDDNTIEIAQKMGARVIKQSFLGYVAQKNFALKHAQFNWVLSLDADEVLSESLRQSLLEIKVKEFDGCAFEFNRRNWYCDRWMKRCGWYPDTKLRLCKKEEGEWVGLDPHDELVVHSKVKRLKLEGDLLHYTYNTIEEHKLQTKRFALISAEAMYRSGKRVSIFKPLLAFLSRFLKTYIIKLGFLEGSVGLCLCLIESKGVYLKYQTLYLKD